MAETEPADTDQGATPDDGGSTTSPDLPGEGLSETDLRQALKKARDEAYKFRQRAKEFGDDEQYRRAKDAVAAVEKAEQDKKSEVEKLTEQSEGLLYRATSAEQSLTKLRVALGAGITSDQIDEFASRLRGESEDELKADAEKLAAFFNAPTSQQPSRRGDPSQGAGSSDATPTDPLLAGLTEKLGIPH